MQKHVNQAWLKYELVGGLLAKLHPTAMDSSLPGSSVHGISQARIME